ncbi:hypothetical protein [Nocardiopsis sp. NPDC057823]|uniref:hypothetical protein n=1 Tax=Nocardiopsis sp. NPDC057823 TaxID=3346256 RepID=UPI00366EA7DA
MNRRIEVEAVSSMSSLPDTAPEDESAAPVGRPGWPMTLAILAVCLAVVASGWWVARVVLKEPEPERPSPEDAAAFVLDAAERMEAADSYALTFTRLREGRPVGEGTASYDVSGNPRFELSFTYADGPEVYHYDLGDGVPITTAGHGLQIPEEPSEADRYLCSAMFGSAKLREIAESSEDLELASREELDTGAGDVTALRYEGTFTAWVGGYDSGTGTNTVESLEGVPFTLWLTPDGDPLRLAYGTSTGLEELYEYGPPPS